MDTMNNAADEELELFFKVQPFLEKEKVVYEEFMVKEQDPKLYMDQVKMAM